MKKKPGGMRCCSLAFVPLEAMRRDRNLEKGMYDGNHHRDSNAPPGWFFKRAMVTECSVVGIGSNPEALLQDAPDTVRKCFGLGCRTTPKKKAWELALANSCRDLMVDMTAYGSVIKAANQGDLETGDSAGLIDRTQSAIPNYRPAEGRSFSCRTCGAFKDGHCLMFDEPVQPNMTCDDWTKEYEEKAMSSTSGSAGGYLEGDDEEEEHKDVCDECGGEMEEDKCNSCGKQFGEDEEENEDAGIDEDGLTAGDLLKRVDEAYEFQREVDRQRAATAPRHKSRSRATPAWERFLQAQAADNAEFARQVGLIN
jgi:hypothetical protein